MIKTKTILIIFSFFAFSTSYSQEWKLIHSNSESNFHIKKNSENTAWIRVTEKETEGYDFFGSEFDKTETVELIKIDFSKKKYGELIYISYQRNGKIIHSRNIEESEVKMEFAIPDTLGELYVNIFCELE